MMKAGKLAAILGTVLTSVAIIAAGCSSAQQAAAPKYQTNIPDGEPDSAVWGKQFPLQYESYLKNDENTVKTKYGGSVPESKYLSQPLLPELFKGYTFALEYNEDRGHTYTIEDVTKIKRVNDKTPSSCWNCKSTQVPAMIEKEGTDFFKVPFVQRKGTITHAIGCANCHDAKTMDLKVTNKNFKDAMTRLGVDLTKATRQDMRTYVCAQCHNEYYFKPDTKEVVNPWDKGYNPDDMVNYYNAMSFSDWQHPDSKTNLIKAQHPEFEMNQTGIHGSNGVSCADCHMPYERDQNKQKYSSHHWQSPLKSDELIDQSCRTCHRDKTTKELKDRVLYTQNKTYTTLLTAQEASNEAHKAVKKALDANGNQDLIKQAQELIRKGQFEWDFVAAENSMGFHNPQLALESLASSIEHSKQAQLLAERAVK